MGNKLQGQFLEAVLGKDGAAVMSKLSASSDMVAATMVPRSIVAWLGIIGNNYEGRLPGVGTSNLSLKKTEAGFTGVLRCGEEYTLSNDSIERTAAVIAVGLGAQMAVSRFKDVDLARLGKTIDLLVKARGRASGGGTGSAAGHIEPTAPAEPTAIAPPMPGQKRKKSRIPRVSSMSVVKSDAQKICKACKANQLDDRGSFHGCWCVRDLEKSLDVRRGPEDSYELHFGEEWDYLAVQTLLKAIGKK